MQTHYKVVEPLREVIPASHKLKSFTLIAPLFAAVIVGTAGGYSSSDLGSVVQSLSHTTLIPAASQAVEEFVEVPSFTVAYLARIREVFGLNMTELALLFAVSRPTVYAWFRGVLPKKDALDSLSVLKEAADEFANLKARNPKSLLRRPVLEGKSALDVLLSGGNVLQELRELIKKLRSEESAVSSRSYSPSKVRRRIYSADDISSTVID